MRTKLLILAICFLFSCKEVKHTPYIVTEISDVDKYGIGYIYYYDSTNTQCYKIDEVKITN